MPDDDPDDRHIDPPTLPSEEAMGTTISRMTRPFVMVGPLMVMILVPAFLYGLQSRRVAQEADDVFVAALAPTADGSGVEFEPSLLCDPGDAATMTTTFTRLDLDGDNHKSSVNGLGFDSVTIDLQGQIDEATADSDDISIHLRGVAGRWCITDVSHS